MARLLEEPGKPILAVDFEHAELTRLFRRDLQHPDGRAGAALAMGAQHLGVVHLVDVVAGEDDQVARFLSGDGVQVLIDRVRGSQVPMLADALLRAEDLHELAQLVRDDAPAHAQMTAEGQRFVLKRDEDPAEPGIDAVAEREVDDPVRAAEVDRRLRPFLGQRVEAFTSPASQHHHESVVLHVVLGVLAIVRRGSDPRAAKRPGHPFAGPDRRAGEA